MDLLRNQPEAALERLNEVLDGTDADTDHSTVTVAMFFAAWAHLDCGNLAKAAELSELAVNRLIEENSVVELLIARRVVGMVAGAQEDYERAAAIFEEVAELARQVPFPHAEACAFYEHGMMCLRQGNLEQARSHLEAGLKIFSRLGAQPYIERTQAALSQLTA